MTCTCTLSVTFLSALYIAWLQIMYGVCNTIFCSPFCISVVKVFRSIGSLFHAVQSPLKSATSFVWSVSVSQLIAVNCFVSLISVQRLARMAVAFLTLWFSASAWNARLVSSNHILSKYSNKVLADAVVKPPLYTTISRSMFWRDVPPLPRNKSLVFRPPIRYVDRSIIKYLSWQR